MFLWALLTDDQLPKTKTHICLKSPYPARNPELG